MQSEEIKYIAEQQVIAELGIEMETFLQSEVGKYLWQRADREIAEANLAFSTADPLDGRLMQTIQNRVKVAQLFKAWVTDAIENGRFAYSTLRQIES